MTPILLLRAKPFLGTVLLALCLRAAGAEFTPEGIEFFEKRIRPVLVERCYKCHSADSEKLKGRLRLDSRETLLQGGESGKPAVTPGDPAKSRLLEAVRYENPDLQMPPKAKLSAEQIADLARWVKLGAPWPQELAAEPATDTAPGTGRFLARATARSVHPGEARSKWSAARGAGQPAHTPAPALL